MLFPSKFAYFIFIFALVCNSTSYADDFDEYNRYDRQLLIEAIQKNNFDEFYRLIHAGVDFNKPEVATGLLNFISTPMTSLEKAVSMRNERFVEMLLERGADPNIFHGQKGRLPLALAMEHKNFDVFKTLLRAMKNTDIQDGYGDTPLMWAAEHVQLRFVEMLLEQGADPNAQNTENGQVALMSTITFWNNLPLLNNRLGTVIDMLLKAGPILIFKMPMVIRY